jgi:hypothetical protein
MYVKKINSSYGKVPLTTKKPVCITTVSIENFELRLYSCAEYVHSRSDVQVIEYEKPMLIIVTVC